MKKLILMIGIILCIAVIGSVLAIAVYDAGDITGTVTADDYIYLSLGAENDIKQFTLIKGQDCVIPIVLSVDRPLDSSNEGKLTITAAAKAATDDITYTLENITIALYDGKDKATATKLAGLESNQLVLDNVSESKTVYVIISFKDNVTEKEIEVTAGSLSCDFKVSA